LSLLSGLLLFACWPVSPFSFLVFIAFVPLLFLAEQCKKRSAYFGWIYLALFIWNAGTTWWTCKASLPGGISAVVANSLLMSIPLLGYYNIKKRMGPWPGYTAFIIFWMCFEYIHLNWELSWPWLTLGNVFATHPGWVQWYEYTGTSGGTLWVLLVNLLIFLAIRNRQLMKSNRQVFIAFGLIILLPAVLSLYLLTAEETLTIVPQQRASTNIVVVQPNIDPWDEKFAAGKEEAQLRNLIRLSESQIDEHTALVVWPETAVPVPINEDSMHSSYFLAGVWDFLKKHPGVNLLTGIEGFRFLTEQNKTAYAQKLPHGLLYAEGYNSAALLDSNRFQIYHKSKLVPGAEVLPSFLHFLDSWFEEFGGTTGGYVRQKERTVLRTYNNTYAIAPAICYESIYGEFMTAYIRGGANLIAVITNDGWWGNTAGYKQHENYARLRAIETRRWMIRSANTGISCFIDPSGKVFEAQPWDKASAIKMNVPMESRMTFFVLHGDLLSKIAVGATILLLAWNLVVIIKTKFNRG
jgi:apolipoprotein N-acyltransferase